MQQLERQVREGQPQVTAPSIEIGRVRVMVDCFIVAMVIMTVEYKLVRREECLGWEEGEHTADK